MSDSGTGAEGGDSDGTGGDSDGTGGDSDRTGSDCDRAGGDGVAGDPGAGGEPSTEDVIRWAAFDVLVEQGFDAFTTQAVADEADVSQSLVHYYFDTKEDLVFAMFSNGLDHLAAEIEARVDADDPRERLLELARYTLRNESSDEFDEAVEFSRFLLEVEAQAPYDERLRETVAYNTEFVREYVVAAVEEGVESGQFRPVEPEPFAAVYLGAMRSGQNLRAIFASDEHVQPILQGIEAIVDGYLLAEDDS